MNIPCPSRRLAARLSAIGFAAALACVSGAAHAQFGSLLQSVMQAQQQAQANEQARREREAAEMEANPRKKWGPAKPVQGKLASEASAFAATVKAEDLRPLFERLYIEGERNATLNFKRIGLAALASGRLDIAEKAFEAAVVRIEMVYADNPEAQKAKSIWNAEKVKDFKGEPYERAMAFFYRGMVYAAKGDFQNARAMFKQADYQDTVAESEQFAGDFGLMPYMAGWASFCDGNSAMAKDFLDQAAKVDSHYVGVAVDRPLLVLFETGRAPFKFGGGRYGELLKWSAHTSVPDEQMKRVCVSDSACTDTVTLAADIGFQATTRGGRPVDAILQGKAAFKDNAQDVAKVANFAGQLGSIRGGRGGDTVGMIGLIGSIAASSAANAAQAQADIREWEQLSNNMWLATGLAKARSDRLVVRVESGGAVTEKQAVRLIDTPTCQLYWGRSVDIASTSAQAGPIEPGEHPRDLVFRREIADTFGGLGGVPAGAPAATMGGSTPVAASANPWVAAASPAAPAAAPVASTPDPTVAVAAPPARDIPAAVPVLAAAANPWRDPSRAGNLRVGSDDAVFKMTWGEWLQAAARPVAAAACANASSFKFKWPGRSGESCYSQRGVNAAPVTCCPES